MNTIVKSLKNKIKLDSMNSKPITAKSLNILLMLFSFLFSIEHLIAQPTITSFAPLSGKVGDTISITGTGFNTTTSNNIVFFGATRAAVTAVTSTSLTVTVPLGATFAPITLLNTATSLAAYSTKFFNPIFSPNLGAITADDISKKVDFSIGNGEKASVVVSGDLDGDGKPDLVVSLCGIYTCNSIISIFRDTGSNGVVSFAPRIDLTISGAPQDLALGDIDGDGKLDIVTANYSGNTVSVLRNTGSAGTISFAPKVDFGTGFGPRSVAIGDLNGDGKLDLAIANVATGANSISVLRNTGSIGTISFATKVDFVSGMIPRKVAICDINGDSKLDLAFTNPNANSISVLRNTSSGTSITFATRVDFSTPGSSPQSIAFGDFDIDGKPDMAIANVSYANVSIFRNTSVASTVSFAPKVDFATGTSPNSIAIGDFDGNGKPDMAIANNSGTDNFVSLLRNTSTIGTINFATKVDFVTGITSNPLSVAIGDFDVDGKLDFVSANGNSLISVFRNNPQFIPTITSISPTIGTIGTSVNITGTNFNKLPSNNIVFFGATRATVTIATDTSLNVIVPIGALFAPITVLNTISVLAAKSTQFFNPTFSPTKGSITSSDMAGKVDFSTETLPCSAAIGDMDGDGKGDIVVANYSSNTVSVFRNTSIGGAVSFAAKVDFNTGTNPTTVAIGDIDGDGKLDIAVGNYTSNKVSVFRNTGSSGSISFATKVDFVAYSIPTSVAIGDVDGDGKLDMVITNNNGINISVFRNKSQIGTINFETRLDAGTGTNPFAMALGDIDGNGKIDLAFTNYMNTNFSVKLNNSTRGIIDLASKVDIATGTNPSSLAIGDLDGNGKIDLAVTNYASNSVSVYRNISTNDTVSFATKVDFTTGSNPKSVAIGDIDGDGKPDLTITNYNSNSASIFRNTCSNGTISFASKVDFITGTNPNSAAIGDLDGDGKPDLAITNEASNSVSVLRNNPQYPPTIFTVGTMSPFGACAGKVSAQQTFTISGVGLTTNILVTAPTGFEVSTNSSSGFGNNVSLSPTATVLNNTLIYVRLSSSASGLPSGNVVCTSSGATTKNIAVIGVVNALTINTSTNIISICPNALPFTWNGRTYNVTSTDTIYLTNYLGCDSITILKLTVKPTSTSTNILSVCSSALPYTWNSRTYNTNGTDTVYLTNAVGCDSVTILKLTVKSISTSTNNISICPSSLPYTWNGRTYGSNRTDTVYLTNSIGCDSVTILKLTIKPTSASTSIISICPSALPYTWNSRTYNSNRTDTVYLTNSVGCDSVTILKLTVKSISTSTNNISICPNLLPFIWNGRTYNTNRTDTVFLTNSVGCDSVTILKLTIKPTSVSTTIISICPSALPYTWNGRSYNTNRTDTVYLTNSLGCDSITILKLTVKSISTSTNNINICSSSLPYSWNGLIFNAAGTQTKTGLTNSVGCDSSATLNLTVKPTSTSTNNVSICPSALPYTWNGLTFSTAGTQTKTGLINSVGCDSSATLNLTVKPTSASTNNLNICSSALPYNWNGLTFSTAGTQTKTGQINSVGCDSSATLNLTVNSSPNTSNIVGLAIVNKLDTASYSVNGLSGSVFNWLVPGATIQSGTGSNKIQVKWTASGTQIVNVTETSNQGCIGTQKTLSVNVSPTTGMNELKANNQVIIYPNPFSETINITLLNNLKLEKAIIYDLVGNEIIISNKNEINASSLKAGVYLIMIVDNIGNSYSEKLVKN